MARTTRKPKSRFEFKLKIDVDLLYHEFEFIKEIQLSDIPIAEITFVDDSTNEDMTVPVIVGVQDESSDESDVVLHCYWDHHPLSKDTIPVHCPLQKIYEPNLLTYTSAINGTTYTISDKLNPSNVHYQTLGVFCSPSCCLAYIRSCSSYDPRFIDSESLLYEMLKTETIQVAPDWTLLDVYGGHLKISEFREGIRHTTYTYEGSIDHSLLFLYKKRYHLSS